jgi:hypothetical protein
MEPDSGREPDTYLVRGRRVHLLDELGRALEVTGRDREVLLGEATAARVLREMERERWAF